MEKKLPIGIQSFEVIRTQNYVYVDKTKDIYQMLRSGKYNFLSRPRRFGKSLTVSVLQALYSGKKELFKDLWIYDHWDWKVCYPIIHIPFSSTGYHGLGVEGAILHQLDEIAKKNDLQITHKDLALAFKDLIVQMSARNPVVILIDEYDKPIIDFLEDSEQARTNRQILKIFYSVIKDLDNYIQFFFVTGVSKFSKVSLFSDLNNLRDITIHPKHSTLVGYTSAELEKYFLEQINDIAESHSISYHDFMQHIRDWYNGYSWDGKKFIYNPFSILSFLDAGVFQNFWFATGTPTFLLQQLRKNMLYQLDETEVGQAAFDSFDIEHISPISLLFQTGYLTIKEVKFFDIYTLNYPNREVKDSLLQYLIGTFSYSDPAHSRALTIQLQQYFKTGEIEKVILLLNSLFHSIPSHIFIKDREAYYHSVIYVLFQYFGIFVDAEVNTALGRIDAVVQTETHIYILEFKLDESVAAAFQQIENRQYAAKYQHLDKSIIGVGINFSSEAKSITDWEAREL